MKARPEGRSCKPLWIGSLFDWETIFAMFTMYDYDANIGRWEDTRLLVT